MKLLSFLIFTLLIMPAPAQTDQQVQKVGALIKDSVESILTILRNKKTSKEKKQSDVYKIVDPLFDTDLMAKLTLGRKNWPKLNDNQRKEFTRLFVSNLKASYFDKIDLITNEKVEYKNPVKKQKFKVHVPTVVVTKDKRYDVIYKVYAKDKEFKVYDVEIEGISIIKSYGSQYDQFLSNDSVDSLLKKMKEKAIAPPEALDNKTRAKGKDVTKKN